MTELRSNIPVKGQKRVESDYKNWISFIPDYKAYFGTETYEPKEIRALSEIGELVKYYKSSSLKAVTKEIPQLEEIYDAIEDSKYIRSLQENWHPEGSLAINPKNYDNAVAFLKMYAQYIFDEFKLVLEEPDIDAARDGSVDLVWRTSKARLLINFRLPEENRAYFYGDNYSDDDHRKGAIPLGSVKDDFALWLKNLTKK